MLHEVSDGPTSHRTIVLTFGTIPAMEWVAVASIVCIIIGAGVMGLAARRASHILEQTRETPFFRNWRILSSLMVFFLLGYAATAGVILWGSTLMLQSLVGLVFLSGAVFVLVVVTTSLGTIEEINAHAAESKAHAAASKAHAAASKAQANELRDALNQLTLVNGSLERSNKELEQFAYVASHDLQEPLRKVKAFGQLLQAEYGDVLGEEGAGYLGRMQNAAVRMSSLIEDLLSLSRVSGKAMEFGEVDLQQMADEVLSVLEVAITDAGATVTTDGLTSVVAEPRQIRQLMQNLIGNGLKFTRPGVPPEIRVLGAVHDHPDLGANTFRLEVRDNGIGIEPHHIDRIFGIFQRLHGRNEYAGTGIGLAICQKIVDRHGGLVRCESTVGEGTTFIVDLPHRKVEETNNG